MRTIRAAPSDPSLACSDERPLASLAGLRVLVVDDDEDSGELLAFVLAAAGATTELASCAMDAIVSFGATRPDVVVCDIAMPDIDGYGLLVRLRATPTGDSVATPVIAMTGFARAEDRERACGAGFDAHLPKPVDVALLIDTIARLTGRVRAT